MPGRYVITDQWGETLAASLDGSYGCVDLTYTDRRRNMTHMKVYRGKVVNISGVHDGVSQLNPDISHRSRIEELIPKLRDAISRDYQAARWHDSLGHL